MALKRLQTRAAARIPYLDGPVPARRCQPRRVVREGHGGDITAMALERLQTRAAARIPYLDGAVVGRRCQARRVVREGHGPDHIAMALERLQTRTPLVAHAWLESDTF